MNSLIVQIDNFISQYNEFVGGYLLLFLLIPTGIYFFIRLRFLNIRKLGYTFKIIGGKYASNEKGEIKPFRALTTALSGTVGTGNIVGVALAIYYGGPGAIFWMWITGFLGMTLKYSECMLSIKYRTIHEDGSVSGGPMYY
ncbi:MAG: alanine:cation symporter family protein, partial [Bacteroidota bacterium]